MSRIEDAEVFVTVVDAGGFTAAARALDLSQPAVSRRVGALEARLGVRLLVRSTRRFRATDAGQAFYERCRRLLSELEEAEHEAAAHGSELRGSLRLAAPPSFGRSVLLPHLAAFAATHPAIELDLALGERPVELNEEGFDLAVRIGDPGRAPGLIRTRLTSFTAIPCAAPAYLAERGTPRQPADLAQHACLVQIGMMRHDRWTLTSDRKGRSEKQTVSVAGPLRSNDVEGLAVACRAGLGVAVLPSFLVGGDLQDGHLRRVLPRWQPRTVEVWAVYAERRHLPARGRALLDFLVERLRRRSAPHRVA